MARSQGVIEAGPPPAKQRRNRTLAQAHVGITEAIDTFKGRVTAYHRGSLNAVCSAAICLIVGTNAGEKTQSQKDVIALLRQSIAESGLHSAQISKYIGIARLMVNNMLVRYKVGGPVIQVLKAATADEATEVLVQYWTKKKVTTLEQLTVSFDRYRRRAPAVAPVTAKVNRHAAPPVQPAKNPEEAADQARAGLAVTLKSLPSDFIVRLAVQNGHTPVNIAKAAIGEMVMNGDLDEVERAVSEQHETIKKMARAAPIAA